MCKTQSMHLFTQTVVIEKKKTQQNWKAENVEEFLSFWTICCWDWSQIKKKKKQGIEFFTVVMGSL